MQMKHYLQFKNVLNRSQLKQILLGFWAVFLDKPFKNRSNRSFWSKILSAVV